MKPRWLTDTKPGHSQWYVERFRQLAAEGADLAGEARFMDALMPPRSRILDAGCGPGRVADELYARGHLVVGVDVDPVLVEAAEVDHPGPRYEVADLSTLRPLPEAPFDAAVIAGNVLVFVAPGTESTVLARVADQLVDGGRLVTGCRMEPHYGLAELDADASRVGLRLWQRFATWDLAPWQDGGSYAVSVFEVGPREQSEHSGH